MSDETPAPPRTPRRVSPEEFRAALDAHDRWLQTDGRDGARLDLTGRSLPAGMSLPGVKLRRAILVRIDWRDADLTGADLRDADLTGATLHQLTLTDARLDGEGTRLAGASLLDLGLAGANLARATLAGVRVAHGDWTGARLDRANLDGGSFEHVRLTDVSLYGASLRGTALRQIDLSGARLLGADLTGANLWRARLGDADLRETTGLVPDETYIGRARFSPAPGVRVPRRRFLRADRSAPWPPGRDPWSILRQTYAGPRAVFLLLGLACFAVPYVARLAALVQLSHGQRLVIQASAADAPAQRPGSGVGRLPGVPNPPDLQTAQMDQVARRFEDQPVPVWRLLLGLNRPGFPWEAARLGLLAAYNVCVFWLVRRVGPMRDEEQRSGYTPPWPEYRRLVRLHGVCSALLYVSLASFVWNMGVLLSEPVYPLKDGAVAPGP